MRASIIRPSSFDVGFDLANDFVASVSMEARQLVNPAHSRRARWVGKPSISVRREAIGGAFYGKLGASAGFVTHPWRDCPCGVAALHGRYLRLERILRRFDGPR